MAGHYISLQVSQYLLKNVPGWSHSDMVFTLGLTLLSLLQPTSDVAVPVQLLHLTLPVQLVG